MLSEPLFTVPEAAEKTRMSISWWRQKISKKEVLHVKIGTRVFLPASSLETVVNVVPPRKGSRYSAATN
jgi:hypothetical protein